MRYLPLTALLADPAIEVDAAAQPEPEPNSSGEPVEPGLLERVLPLLHAFEHDLLWAQSRAAQELFHSNTIAWLLHVHSLPCTPLLNAFGATEYQALERVDVWREKKTLTS